MRRHTQSALSACLLLGAGSLFAACGGGGGTPTGRLNVEVTDDPFVYSLVDEAVVGIDKIRVHHQSQAESGFLTIYEGTPIDLDLLQLRNGLTTIILRASLPAGLYRQMRLHVANGHLLLNNGNMYTTADETLRLTSTASSGFKVFFDPPIDVPAGGLTSVLLDFDLTKTFHPVPSSDPLNADYYQLQPVIRSINRALTGDIRGTVTRDDMGTQVPVEGATVYVLPEGETDPALAIATTASDVNGAYMVMGLAPDVYDVLAAFGSLSGQVLGVTVASGSAALADIMLE